MRHACKTPPAPALTARERHILAELRRDESLPSLARRLGISVETLRTHTKALSKKPEYESGVPDLLFCLLCVLRVFVVNPSYFGGATVLLTVGTGGFDHSDFHSLSGKLGGLKSPLASFDCVLIF